jgi:methylenetetrahydrofolate reductase (NADPH)
VPDAIIARLEGAQDQAAEGRRICAELITALREIEGVAGAHVMAPAQGTEAIAAVLDSL